MMENEMREWSEFKRHGFGLLPIWAGSGNPQIILKFADGVVTGSRLVPNPEKTKFTLKDLPKEWKDHGVQDVTVDSGVRKSVISVQMNDGSGRIECTKAYS
jgi:hypothetical protein